MISIKIIVIFPVIIFAVSVVIAALSSLQLHKIYLLSEDEGVKKIKEGESKLLSHFYFSEGFFEYVNNYECDDPVYLLLKKRIKKCLFICILSFVSIIPTGFIYVWLDHFYG